MTDWYPTLLRLGGASLDQALPLDGKDIWAAVADGRPSPRDEILHNIDRASGAVRKGPWKLLVSARMPVTDLADARVELYNIAEDPTEKNDLASNHPEIVKDLFDRVRAYSHEAVPARSRE